jgi:hypothetical protein
VGQEQILVGLLKAKENVYRAGTILEQLLSAGWKQDQKTIRQPRVRGKRRRDQYSFVPSREVGRIRIECVDAESVLRDLKFTDHWRRKANLLAWQEIWKDKTEYLAVHTESDDLGIDPPDDMELRKLDLLDTLEKAKTDEDISNLVDKCLTEGRLRQYLDHVKSRVSTMFRNQVKLVLEHIGSIEVQTIVNEVVVSNVMTE